MPYMSLAGSLRMSHFKYFISGHLNVSLYQPPPPPPPQENPIALFESEITLHSTRKNY